MASERLTDEQLKYLIEAGGGPLTELALAELKELRAKLREAMQEVTDGIYFWDDRRDTALFAVCRVLDKETYDLIPGLDGDDDYHHEGAKAAYLKWHPGVAACQPNKEPH
jgi:uncharacterized protein YdhG (YjbR/CyaY superfamily)